MVTITSAPDLTRAIKERIKSSRRARQEAKEFGIYYREGTLYASKREREAYAKAMGWDYRPPLRNYDPAVTDYETKNTPSGTISVEEARKPKPIYRYTAEDTRGFNELAGSRVTTTIDGKTTVKEGLPQQIQKNKQELIKQYEKQKEYKSIRAVEREGRKIRNYSPVNPESPALESRPQEFKKGLAGTPQGELVKPVGGTNVFLDLIAPKPLTALKVPENIKIIQTVSKSYKESVINPVTKKTSTIKKIVSADKGIISKLEPTAPAVIVQRGKGYVSVTRIGGQGTITQLNKGDKTTIIKQFKGQDIKYRTAIFSKDYKNYNTVADTLIKTDLPSKDIKIINEISIRKPRQTFELVSESLPQKVKTQREIIQTPDSINEIRVDKFLGSRVIKKKSLFNTVKISEETRSEVAQIQKAKATMKEISRQDIFGAINKKGELTSIGRIPISSKGYKPKLQFGKIKNIPDKTIVLAEKTAVYDFGKIKAQQLEITKQPRIIKELVNTESSISIIDIKTSSNLRNIKLSKKAQLLTNINKPVSIGKRLILKNPMDSTPLTALQELIITQDKTRITLINPAIKINEYFDNKNKKMFFQDEKNLFSVDNKEDMKEKNRFEERQESRITQDTDSLFKIRTIFEQDTKPKQDIDTLSDTKIVQDVDTIKIVEQIPDYIPVPKPPKIKTLPEEPIVETPKIIIPPFKIFSTKTLSQETKETGYNVYMYEENKKVKANLSPLPKQEAERLGRDIADNSLSASYKVTKTNINVPSSKRSSLATGGYVPESKFYESKSKSRKGFFVEKENNRLDSLGERKGIKASQLISERKNKIKDSFGFGKGSSLFGNNNKKMKRWF